MQLYPLIFSFRDVVEGKGFLAGVQVDGTGVLEYEDGAWWMTGVQPAGIADHGSTQQEAYQAFRDTFRKVLFDSATLAKNFEEFDADVKKISGQVDAHALEQWTKAREKVRKGEKCDGFAGGLGRVTREVRPEILIVRLDRKKPATFTPKDNKDNQVELAAVA